MVTVQVSVTVVRVVVTLSCSQRDGGCGGYCVTGQRDAGSCGGHCVTGQHDGDCGGHCVTGPRDSGLCGGHCVQINMTVVVVVTVCRST